MACRRTHVHHEDAAGDGLPACPAEGIRRKLLVRAPPRELAAQQSPKKPSWTSGASPEEQSLAASHAAANKPGHILSENEEDVPKPAWGMCLKLPGLDTGSC